MARPDNHREKHGGANLPPPVRAASPDHCAQQNARGSQDGREHVARRNGDDTFIRAQAHTDTADGRPPGKTSNG